MKLEEVLPAIRQGKQVRRKGWDKFDNWLERLQASYAWESVLEDDWEIVSVSKRVGMITDDYAIVAPKPKRVADYAVPCVPLGARQLYSVQTFEIGTEPESALRIEGSERDE